MGLLVGGDMDLEIGQRVEVVEQAPVLPVGRGSEGQRARAGGRGLLGFGYGAHGAKVFTAEGAGVSTVTGSPSTLVAAHETARVEAIARRGAGLADASVTCAWRACCGCVVVVVVVVAGRCMATSRGGHIDMDRMGQDACMYVVAVAVAVGYLVVGMAGSIYYFQLCQYAWSWWLVECRLAPGALGRD